MTTTTARVTVGDERLVSTEGTIIPMGLGFAGGVQLVVYHVGADAWFTECGASRSLDGGETWEVVKPPMRGCAAIGQTGADAALFLDQYLVRTGPGRYAVRATRTMDAGASFEGTFWAEFRADGLLEHGYTPRAGDDPDRFVEPEIPGCYEELVVAGELAVGGHLFGRVVRLADGALGVCGYAQVAGNVGVAARDSGYVGARPDEANAAEGQEKVHWSALFFRSEDEGVSWSLAGTMGRAEVGQPFDWEHRFAEGFTEANVGVAADGSLFALMRQGSYLLMYSARSVDGGRSWSPVEAFNYPGVAPSLCQLGNGVLAVGWGRPGMTVGFSLGGEPDEFEVMTCLESDRVQSQKYLWLEPLGEDAVCVFYDRRVWNSATRWYDSHGIYCRSVRVQTGASVS